MSEFNRERMLAEYEVLKAGRKKTRRRAWIFLVVGLLIGAMCFVVGVIQVFRERFVWAFIEIALAGLDWLMAFKHARWLHKDTELWAKVEVLHDVMMSWEGD